MGDHFRRLDLFRLHQRHRGAHIVSITAGGADVVGKGVVHVVEVDRGAELLILGASKEIQAAVRSQQRGGQGDQLFVWHKHEDIVEAMAAAERQQRIATGLMAVEVVDQRLRLRGVMTAGVAELRLIGIGHYQ